MPELNSYGRRLRPTEWGTGRPVRRLYHRGVDGLFERGAELEQIGAHLARASSGGGCLVVVEGPAGIGKTRLLAEVRRQAESNRPNAPLVLHARGSELEVEFAFGIVRQLFETELARRGQEPLAGTAASAAAVFGLVDTSTTVPSFAVLHGLFWLIVNLADEGPVLLLIDDLHWCDRPSLQFLTYLARRLDGLPVLLLAGLREAEPGADPALLAELTRDPAAYPVHPGPLGSAAVAALVESRLGTVPEPEFVAACELATGGNPLLLTQLVSALGSEGVRPDATQVARVAQIGPRAVSRTVLMRLSRLGAPAHAVAEAVAILGDGAALPTVAELAGVSQADVAEATRALVQAEILRPEPPLSFVHPLVRDAVYHGLASGERELRHAAAATVLRRVAAPPERIAAQLLHTSTLTEPWVTALLREAGRAAMQAGAADSAVAYLRRALDTADADEDRGRLLLDLGSAEALTSGLAAATHLQQAYEELVNPAARAEAAAQLGRTLMFMGSPAKGAAVARRTAAELPDELTDQRLALLAFECMTVYFGTGDLDRLRILRGDGSANSDADVAIDSVMMRPRPGPLDGPGAHMFAAMAAWDAACTDGTAAECAELALAALDGPTLVAADPALIPYAALVALITTDRPEAVELLELMVSHTHRRGSLVAASSMHLWSGFGALQRGDLAGAEELLRVAERELAMWGHSESAVRHSRCHLAEVLYERGELQKASEMLESMGAVDPGHNTTGWWLQVRAKLLTGMDRPAEALAATDELLTPRVATIFPVRLWGRSLRAEALERLGRRGEAIELAAEEVAETRAFGAPSALGRSLRILGTLQRHDGIDAVTEAVAVLENSTARLEYAKALAALGAALRRARRATEAREPLRQALDLATACGAARLAEQVRTELVAAGVRPRRDAASGAAALTPGERRVALLAAAGRSNRDIAQELFVTPKTVEVHLSNAYRKLAIRSRAELESVLAGS
jgi:DNA-binding CsgD family transcriptional regulator